VIYSSKGLGSRYKFLVTRKPLKFLNSLIRSIAKIIINAIVNIPPRIVVLWVCFLPEDKISNDFI